MTKVCASCGEQNPDKARFCMACTAPLADQHIPGKEERRRVTVLFCDLVGFTSRSESLDVEDVQGFLGRYHTLLRRELERHGGTVEKFIGDAVMALFGAPVAHEDDPERAVRAALSIQDAVAGMRASDGLDLHVRVGVTTGEALVTLTADPSAGEGMATGDVVNTAARVQSAAPVDGVLVDTSTYRATDRAVRYAEAEPVLAKGKSTPVAVWQAVEPRSLVPEQSRADDLPIVDRRQEAAQLVTGLERSRQEPSTQLVTIIGAPGIGKTRLVRELYRHAESLPAPIRWRQGRSLAYGAGIAFWALGEMIKAEAGILESDHAATAAEKLQEAVAAVIPDERDREWVVRHLRPLVGLETAAAVAAEGGRVEAFAAWRRFFEALAEDGPTVLAFEDAHWGDDGLLDFIDLLADRAGAVPLLIVCAARPELIERRPGWSGGRTNANTLLLPPLSDDDMARLVSALLDQSLLPAETQRTLLDRAEGNPLYAQEYVRMLRDRGLLVHEGGGWRLTSEPHELPESVQGIIAARLDTLAAEERRFVQDAAVVGRTGWVGAVRAISGSSSGEVEELMHGLERKQLLRRSRRSSVAEEIEFSFQNGLTQEVAYGQIKRIDRAHKHERTAAWIGQLGGERDDKAELLAHHYSLALRLREQAGEDSAELRSTTRAALAEAGAQAAAVYAQAAAAGHFDAALALGPQDDELQRTLLLGFARAAVHAGLVDEAALERALEAQVAAADWASAAEAAYLYSSHLIDAGKGERARTMLDAGAGYARRVDYAPVMSAIDGRRAHLLMVGGQPLEAVAMLEPAIERARRAGDSEGGALLSLTLGSTRETAGDDGLAQVADAASVLAAHSHPAAASAHHGLAMTFESRGDLHSGRDASQQAVLWAERFGDVHVIAFCRVGLAAAMYHEGRWDDALDITTELAGSSSRFAAAYARGVRGLMMLARGDIDVAVGDAEAVLAYSLDGENQEGLLAANVLLARIRHGQQRFDEADEICAETLARWQSGKTSRSMVSTLAELTPIVRQRAALGRAADLLPDASPWKGALQAIGGNRDGDAAHRYADIGSRPLEAAAHLLAAGAGGADGSAHAQSALDIYRELGATLYADRAAGLLQASA